MSGWVASVKQSVPEDGWTQFLRAIRENREKLWFFESQKWHPHSHFPSILIENRFSINYKFSLIYFSIYLKRIRSDIWWFEYEKNILIYSLRFYLSYFSVEYKWWLHSKKNFFFLWFIIYSKIIFCLLIYHDFILFINDSWFTFWGFWINFQQNRKQKRIFCLRHTAQQCCVMN